MTTPEARGGRDQLPPMQRVATILAQLDDAGSAGIDADELLSLVGYAGSLASQRDMLARDVRHLRGAGWDIVNVAEAGAAGHYVMRRGDPRIQLAFPDPAERREFERTAQLAGVSGTRLAETLSESGAGLERQASVRQSPAYLLQRVTLAHEQRCLLHFDYRDRRRTVVPDQLLLLSGRWYVHGREAGQEEAKSFRLDRMTRLSLDRPGTAGAAVDWPELSLDPLTFADGPEVLAEVEVHADHRAAAERALGPAERAVREGDRLVLTIPVVSHATFRRRLFELGTRARLLGPESLRQEIRDVLIAIERGDA